MAARASGIGNDDEPGSTTQTAIGKARRFVDIARAASARAIAAWTKKRRTRSLSRTMTVLGWIAVIAVCLYVGLTAMIYLAQRSLMYFPDTIHTTPAEAGLPEATEVPLTAADGVQIRVWYVPPQRRQTGHPLFPRQRRLTALSRRALSPADRRRHRPRRARISRLRRLRRQSERARPDRRRRSGLRLRSRALSGAADRALGRVARLRRCGRARGGKAGRPRHPGSAVHLGARRRRDVTGTCRCAF